MPQFTPTHTVKALAALLTSSVALTALAPATAHATPTTRSAPSASQSQSSRYCTAKGHQELADRLNHDIAKALAGRKSTVSFTVWDKESGLSCAFRPNVHYDAASIVKVTIMTATLLRAQEEQRPLATWEESSLKSMITQSDNQAATDLYTSLGAPFIQYTLRRSGMNDTTLDPEGNWGLTQVTAHDEMRQLDVYTVNGAVLSPQNKAYGLRLMSEVEPSQRWGTPFGAPPGVKVHVKNGWLQRVTRGWRVHSLGIFTEPGDLYQMAVLTDEDPTMSYGIGTIQRIAWHVNRDLAEFRDDPATAVPPYEPDYQGSEIGDGTADPRYRVS
ncbi:serine hydrolase [Streptomyces sp. NBC_01264]|uniref:serine hydrolase n=1 Tax=Streptomyces sp. NBC_01264 TaxID=2903804 RepID=UPI0022577138|nr:serine hydrolase [Streptomyces sp. NBC_01264]MCX4784239.1 class A beta-lactamase-related serine hydrolase [Streptomyces sp. NBC_01264]